MIYYTVLKACDSCSIRFLHASDLVCLQSSLSCVPAILVSLALDGVYCISDGVCVAFFWEMYRQHFRSSSCHALLNLSAIPLLPDSL